VWLKRVRNAQTDRPGAEQAAGKTDGVSVLRRTSYAGTRADWTESDPRYACQLTELFRATERLPWWDVRQYLEDYESGNASLAECSAALRTSYL